MFIMWSICAKFDRGRPLGVNEFGAHFTEHAKIAQNFSDTRLNTSEKIISKVGFPLPLETRIIQDEDSV